MPLLAFQPACATCSSVPILPSFWCCCFHPVLPANVLLHTRCWQQLHLLNQGFVAAFATGEHRARAAAASRWKITYSQSFPAFSWVFSLLFSSAETFITKKSSCLRVLRVTVEIFPELGAYFPLSICVTLPTLNFTFCFPASSLRAARCFCSLLQAAPILTAPNNSIPTARLLENEA